MPTILNVNKTGFIVTLTDEGQTGYIENSTEPFSAASIKPWDVAWGTLGAVILAQAMAGIDITSDAYSKVILDVIDTLVNQYGDD